uniref:Membrane steroid-binding protein 1 n=1 Tax=Aegilops tauschii TaxID=37682 RepID=M8B444_AEGTA
MRRRATGSPRLPDKRVSGAVRCRAAPGGLGISGKVAELWQAARSAPPGTVLAAVAAAAAVYKVASGLLAPPPPPPRRWQEVADEALPPAPEPVQVGEITADELRQYDGSDPEKPLLMAIKGQIYDVSQSRYAYKMYMLQIDYWSFSILMPSIEHFCCCRALAKMSFEPQDLTGDVSGLGPFELSALQDWEYKFTSKYVKVGTVKGTGPIEQGNVSTTSEIQEEAAAVKLNGEKAP